MKQKVFEKRFPKRQSEEDDDLLFLNMSSDGKMSYFMRLGERIVREELKHQDRAD